MICSTRKSLSMRCSIACSIHCVTIRIDGPSLRSPEAAGVEPPAAASLVRHVARPRQPAGDRRVDILGLRATRMQGPHLIKCDMASASSMTLRAAPRRGGLKGLH